jgi:hypothetical protein
MGAPLAFRRGRRWSVGVEGCKGRDSCRRPSVQSGGGSEKACSWPEAYSTESDARRARIRARTPGGPQPPAPRALRPCSASSTRSSSSVDARGRIQRGSLGSTPWQPSIGGGVHTSYTAIMSPEEMPDYQALAKADLGDPNWVDRITRQSSEGSSGRERRLTMCPHMRAKGKCGLPSCPFIHEVCRSRREHTPLSAGNPLYNTCAPKTCGSVPCRFFKVLGSCPHGDNCVYSHGQESAPCASTLQEHNKTCTADGASAAPPAEAATTLRLPTPVR